MKKFGKRINLFLIILIGCLIGGAYLLEFGIGSTREALGRIGYALLMTGGIWIGCMVIVQWLWRKFPWEFYPGKHMVIEIVLITLYTMTYSFMVYLIVVRTGGSGDYYEDLPMQIFATLLITYLITSIHEMVYFYKQWKYHFSKSVRLEKDNIQARYETLKTQVNPHFLFNSLNSLTTLVDDNKDAVQYIQNMSEFLRYMLGSRDKELVLIREEIRVLGKYVSLQQFRFRNTLFVDLQVPERFYHYAIPPLVLQMLVENCIKHNVISKDQPLHVNIRAGGETLTVENNLQKKSGVVSTGQGLKNISERYRLFTSREVKITETSAIFKVAIPLLTVEL